MLKYALIIAVVVAVALPTFAMAAWNPVPMSSCSSCAPMCSKMSACRTVVNTSFIQMNEQKMMVPLVVPTLVTPTGCSMCTPDMAMSDQVTMVTRLVPASVQTIDSNPVICASTCDDLANKVVMLPTVCSGAQTLAPVLVKPMGHGVMTLAPLSECLNPAAAPASLAVFVRGNMCMAPINCGVSTKCGSVCVDASAAGNCNLMCDKNNY